MSTWRRNNRTGLYHDLNGYVINRSDIRPATWNVQMWDIHKGELVLVAMAPTLASAKVAAATHRSLP